MDETVWMREALECARRGPAVDPNPRVGALIVADGQIVGRGWHDGAGTPHAEVRALADAGAAARGATAVVTLEPCHHTGRTGPCTAALLDAGVARVVHAQSDPNPAAAGGAAALRAAGVEVTGGILAEEAAALNADWSRAIRLARPAVVWKVASTLDGRTAAPDGSSRWITSPEARADAHALRATCGAVIVGTGTVAADNPRLTVRTTPPPERQPLPVVVGRRDLPADTHLHHTALHLRTHSPADVVVALHARGIRKALLEGGATLAGAFWRAGLIDDVVTYLAPALLGDGPPTIRLDAASIDDIARLRLTDVTRVGPDLRLTLQPKEH